MSAPRVSIQDGPPEPDEVFQAVRNFIYLHPLQPVPEASELVLRLAGEYLSSRPEIADVMAALEALDIERGVAA